MSSRVLMLPVVALLAAAVVALGAWSRGGEGRAGDARGSADPAVSTPATPAEPLPAPKGDVVLRVDDVARGNVSASTSKADYATLDGLAHERITVYEPFLKRDVTFTGVRMGELLARLGVASSAKRLYLRALDDYHVELPIADVASYGLLATRADGNPIPIAKGGPIRLVFLEGSKLGANTDNWIWSLDSIRVRR